MISLSLIILVFLVVILIGKHTVRLRPLTYVVIGILALVQVAIVVYEMFTLPNPLQ
jgi:hypothetical protein